jgi:uncharacterized membrane-anchored protein
MNPKTLALAFVCAAQLAVPLWSIVDHERTIKSGEEFLFLAAPVDPYDAFRGRYVRVNLDDPSVYFEDGASLERGQDVYVTIAHGEDGLTEFLEVFLDPPTDGMTYIKVECNGFWESPENVRLSIPIDRYYMEETLAPEAERAYGSASRDEETQATVSLRIYKGKSVLTGLFIDGIRIEEHLAAQD